MRINQRRRKLRTPRHRLRHRKLRQREYQLWRARRERAAALREELKLGEEAKDYLKRADVETAIDDRLAPLLASEPDTHKIRAILTEERNHTLNNLAAGFATLTKK